MARTADFIEPDQRDLPCPVLRSKRFRFAADPNQNYNLRCSIPLQGRIAIVTDVGMGCGGRFGDALTSGVDADGEVVWSWRSDAGAKLAELSADDGGNQAWSPGRARN